MSASETTDLGKNDDKVVVFMDFTIGDEKVGRVVMELFKDIAPRTCENFRALCTGEKGVGASGLPLHYKGSVIHKTVPCFMMQGGDITNFDGSGGETIYGSTFEDESFEMRMLDVGIVGMANLGRPDTNTSQFFIAVAPFPHLEGKNVAFGKVCKGLGVVNDICNTDRSEKDVPLQRVQIVDCGELSPGSDWGYIEHDGLDQYPPYPEDWEIDSGAVITDEIARAISNIKETGNQYYAKGDYQTANRKYKKAVRYIQWARNHQHAESVRVVDPEDPDQYSVVLLNMAAARLRMKRYRDAYNLCNEIIEKEPDSPKAYFRRGQANFGLNNYDAALRDLKKAQHIEPGDTRIRAEVARVKEAIKMYHEQEKKRYANMLK